MKYYRLMTSNHVLERLLSSVDLYVFSPFHFRLFVDLFHGFNNRNVRKVCTNTFIIRLLISMKSYVRVFLEFAIDPLIEKLAGSTYTLLYVNIISFLSLLDIL